MDVGSVERTTPVREGEVVAADRPTGARGFVPWLAPQVSAPDGTSRPDPQRDAAPAMPSDISGASGATPRRPETNQEVDRAAWVVPPPPVSNGPTLAHSIVPPLTSPSPARPPALGAIALDTPSAKGKLPSDDVPADAVLASSNPQMSPAPEGTMPLIVPGDVRR
jgi:hypothetical protein